MPYLQFKLGPESYGVPYQYLSEVLTPSEIATIPCTPEHIRGLVNRRSELLTVIDLKPLFQIVSIEKERASKKLWVIVITDGDNTFGLLADSVNGNKNYEPESLSAPLPTADKHLVEYIEGIYEGKTMILNAGAILKDDKLAVEKK
jgi:purine-binding chemotaxis protein CheW